MHLTALFIHLLVFTHIIMFAILKKIGLNLIHDVITFFIGLPLHIVWTSVTDVQVCCYIRLLAVFVKCWQMKQLIGLPQRLRSSLHGSFSMGSELELSAQKEKSTRRENNHGFCQQTIAKCAAYSWHQLRRQCCMNRAKTP